MEQFERLAVSLPDVAEKVAALESACAALYGENARLSDQLESRHSAMTNIRQSLTATLTATPPPPPRMEEGGREQ